MLTHDIEVCGECEGRVRGDLTLVRPLVTEVHGTYPKLPIWAVDSQGETAEAGIYNFILSFLCIQILLQI